MDTPPAQRTSVLEAALEELWKILEPTFEELMQKVTEDERTPPALTASQHMQVHTAVFNYLLSNDDETGQRATTQDRGDALYWRMNEYYEAVAREIFRQAPKNALDLASYLMWSFEYFRDSACAISRLLSYFETSYIKPEVCHTDDRRHRRRFEKHASLMQEQRCTRPIWAVEEVRDYLGYQDEAERIIPLTALAHLKFLTEVVGPLLAAPSGEESNKTLIGQYDIPECRLCYAIRVYLEDKETSPEDRRQGADYLADNLLRTTDLDPFLAPFLYNLRAHQTSNLFSAREMVETSMNKPFPYQYSLVQLLSSVFRGLYA